MLCVTLYAIRCREICQFFQFCHILAKTAFIPSKAHFLFFMKFVWELSHLEIYFYIICLDNDEMSTIIV
jgi:hypothetical protein